jgi:hypothetical protein
VSQVIPEVEVEVKVNKEDIEQHIIINHKCKKVWATEIFM